MPQRISRRARIDELVVKEHPEVYRESVLGAGSNGPDPRIANFLLITRELGQSHTLQQLAKMNGESLRSTIRRMLLKMAH